MSKHFPNGVWPVMLTPYTDKGDVDYKGLKELTNWYIEKGVSGLFAVCQSSEMFFLSLDERIKVAKTVVETADKRVPVIASGHISDDINEQIAELTLISQTGIDALILITNRMATEQEEDAVWIENLEKLLAGIPADIPLGLYECPYPYKRLLSEEVLRQVIKYDRFYFLKDTSCDYETIVKRQEIIKGSTLKLFNANTATILDTLRAGIAGYSGVMSNFHPELYLWLYKNINHKKAETLQEFLSLAAFIERQVYPVNAKYALIELGIDMGIFSRSKDMNLLDATAKDEVRQLMNISEKVWQWLVS